MPLVHRRRHRAPAEKRENSGWQNHDRISHMEKVWIILLLSSLVPLMAQSPDPNLAFSTANLDRTANPCVDFYRYSCGTWLARNPVPPDESSWGRFDVLQERNRQILRDILEKAAIENPQRNAIE